MSGTPASASPGVTPTSPVPALPLGTPGVSPVGGTATPRQIETENIQQLQADNKRLSEQSRALATRKQELALENKVLQEQLGKNAAAAAPSLANASAPTPAGSPAAAPSPMAAPAVKGNDNLRMGATPARDGIFGPVEPVRTVVLSRRPRLRWESAARHNQLSGAFGVGGQPFGGLNDRARQQK